MKFTTLYRFMIRAIVTDGCWDWLGTKTQDGYGHFSDGKRTVPAHRFAYEVLVGKTIPKGEVSGLCQFCRYQTRCSTDGGGLTDKPLSIPKNQSEEVVLK